MEPDPLSTRSNLFVEQLVDDALILVSKGVERDMDKAQRLRHTAAKQLKSTGFGWYILQTRLFVNELLNLHFIIITYPMF